MSTTAPPPKSSGTKPFVIAVLLMLLLMGGLIYLKLSGEEEKPAATPVPTATATEPVIDQVIPPPPPPPPSASAAPTVASKKAAPKFDSGCSTCGNCQGTEANGFARLRGAVRMARYGGDCYAYGLLAAGFVDLVVEAGLKPHDVVALVPIIERAGGCITTWGGLPAKEGGRILASGDPRLHEAALRVLST